MITLQPLDTSLPSPEISSKSVCEIKTDEHLQLAHIETVETDTDDSEVSLPVSCSLPIVCLPEQKVSEPSSLPVQCALLPKYSGSLLAVSPQSGASASSVSALSGSTLLEIHPVPKTINGLSVDASDFTPSVVHPEPDPRPYPPGVTKDGVEWTQSDNAWVTLEYGNHEVYTGKPVPAAKPDIVDTRTLKNLEVKLPNGGVFDDKVLPSCSAEVVPNGNFSKEYFIDLHKKVREYGTYNYAGAKVKLEHSNLNIQLFRHYLQDYEDLGILSYLEYGFPIGLSQVFYLEPLTKNHSSSYQYFSYIDQFLAKGVLLGECSGPWSEAPIDPFMISPIMTADKAPSSRRAVFDASFGNFSLNQNTPEKEYLGEEYNFKFPSVLDLADLIVKLGRGCLLYKRDLSRWFLQLPVDPGDYDKLGFVWRGKFWLFSCYVWGCRHAGMSGQRVASAILYILKKLGVEVTKEEFNAIVYMDDFAGCEHGQRAKLAFDALGKLLADLGVRESIDKACPPSTTMRFLGVEFDTVKMCMRIDDNKRKEIQQLSVFWSRKTVANKQELQSILGKLIWVSKVVRFSRCFVSRVISLIKTLKYQKQKTTLTEAVKKDFKWWSKFLSVFNGVELLIPPTVFASVLGDAYPMGSGSWNEQAKDYYSRKFPMDLCDTLYPIHLKEFWSIIIATKL